MHTVTFFPSGNADTCFIQLDNGRIVVYDYADMRDKANDKDKRIDLQKAVRDRVGKAERVSVLAFSHLDQDHFKGASDLFWFDHAEKYQSDDRIKIDTLWVPAAAVLEEGIEDEGRIIRAEARHRLREGAGIRVFSTPQALDEWLKGEGISPADRADLITDAGNLAPGFNLADDGIEFFVHSPFAERCEDGSLVVRNESALFMQATFSVENELTRLILSADCHHEILEEIVRVTRHKGNDDRLLADISNIPHHCSYKSLAEEKGKDQTEPSKNIKWCYEKQSQSGCVFVSTSDVIPTEDTVQPPHRQAASYYKSVANDVAGEFIVTMAHPTKDAPEPLVFEITKTGPKVKKRLASSATILTSSSAPRAGCN